MAIIILCGIILYCECYVTRKVALMDDKSIAMDLESETMSMTEREIEDKRRIGLRIMPLIVSIVLLVLGIGLNLYLLSQVEEGTIIMIGKIDQQFLVRTLYYTWTIGAISLPYTIYYAFGNNKNLTWILLSVVVLALMGGCMYLGAKDEMRVTQSIGVSYDYYSDGEHCMVIANEEALSGNIIQHFYVRSSKFRYSWIAAGTESAVIEFVDEGASIVENGEVVLVLDYANFYID